MINRKEFYDNESAVSVLIGTLALIAVVIVGSIGIATIVGSFSSDVSKHASPEAASAATQTPVYVAGSDNMDGLTRSLADSYTAENAGVRIVSGIISPDSVYNSINSKITDIGALAGTISYTDITKNPNIKTTQIGSSAVVIITNKASPAATTTVGVSELQKFFTADVTWVPTNIDGGAKLVTRSDKSGTADTFYNNFLGKPTYIGGAAQLGSDADVISYVASASNPKAIGFADYGDVQTAISNNGVPISMISIDDGINLSYPAGSLTYDNLKVAAKDQYLSTQRHADGSPVWTGSQLNCLQYNLTLMYPLYYITKDKPNTLQQGILDYATSPAARPAFIKANVFSVADF